MHPSTWSRLRRAACHCPSQRRLFSSRNSWNSSSSTPDDNGAEPNRYNRTPQTRRNSDNANFRKPGKRLSPAEAARERRRQIVDGELPEDHEPEPRSTKWPLLKRRRTWKTVVDGVGYYQKPNKKAQPAATPGVGKKALATTDEQLPLEVSPSHLMLTIHGLSKNVNASDFYRLSENDLSSWNASIRRGKPPIHPHTRSVGSTKHSQANNSVTKSRDATTLEPTGSYHLTFPSSTAAVAYAERFRRLHRMARCRADSRTGLWQSELAPELHGAADPSPEALEDEVALLTAAAGTHGAALQHGRVSSPAWARRVAELVAGDGHGEQPPVVLLEVNPIADQWAVRKAVRAQGRRVGASWATARPHPLGEAVRQAVMSPPQRASEDITEQPSKELDDKENDDESAIEKDGEEEQEKKQADANKQKADMAADRERRGAARVARHMEGTVLRRYVISFRDDSEARRFHRSWNGRWLHGEGGGPKEARHSVRTQVIEW